MTKFERVMDIFIRFFGSVQHVGPQGLPFHLPSMNQPGRQQLCKQVIYPTLQNNEP